METPFLAASAQPVDGTVVGHTMITAAEPETSDDEPRLGCALIDPGSDIPFLGAAASAVDGDVRGQTIITRTPAETTDDPSIS